MKNLKLIEQNGYLFIASYGELYEVTDEEYDKICGCEYKTKLVDGAFVFEEDIEAKQSLLENEIIEKVKRMEEINKELLNLGGSNALVSYPALDTIRTNKITALTNEFNAIKTDLDTNYDSTLINDILTSLFS